MLGKKKKREKEMTEWISVNCKMPETDKPVLCYGKLDGEVQIFAGCWDNANNLQSWYCFPMTWCSCCRQPDTDVTHWMPYPKGPIYE